LFDTIPGIKIIVSKSGSYTKKTKRLPDNPDLTRFNIYAPCVRSTMMSSDTMGEYENWDGFQSISQSTILLPNLSRIFLMVSHTPQQELITWIFMFLSPALKKFLSGNQRWIGGSLGEYERLDIEQASRLLSRTASVCPSLVSLDIYPSTLPNNRHPDPTHSFFSDFCRSVQSFTCLRELSTNSLVLERRSFLTIAAHPALESLTLYPCAYDEAVGSPALPEDAFPALRCLNLEMMNSGSVTQLCGLEPLVRRLTTLGVLPQPNNIYPRPPSLRLAQAMSALAKSNSSLSSLLIGDRTHYSAATVEVGPVFLEQLRHFPLKRLTLSKHIFALGSSLQNLLEVLPNVEDLSLDHDGFITPKQLCAFASCEELPNLRALELSVSFKTVPSFVKAGFQISQTQSLARLKLTSCFNHVGEDKRLAKLVAKFLHTLWPNVTCALTSRIGSLNVEDGEKSIRLVEAELVELRQQTALV
ncbi:hypothetical protein BDV93DRAFT_594424, partial [Ceratobasidium sp. AG-I]